MNQRVESITMYWSEWHVPYRCRKPRMEEKQDQQLVPLSILPAESAPIVLRHPVCSDYETVREYRAVHGKLYRRLPYRDIYCGKEGWCPVEALKPYLESVARQFLGRDVTKDKAASALQEAADHFLLLDGHEVWQEIEEPRYVIMTFGLGHNHAETALMITNRYNENIPRDCYFSALEADAAVEQCCRVAENRGDTNSLPDIRNSWRIEVLDPSVIHVEPRTQHGEGNPLLRRMESLVSGAPDKMTAQILVIMEAAAQGGAH